MYLQMSSVSGRTLNWSRVATWLVAMCHMRMLPVELPVGSRVVHSCYCVVGNGYGGLGPFAEAHAEIFSRVQFNTGELFLRADLVEREHGNHFCKT